MAVELTVAALGKAKFRGPVAFYDGRGGMARQDFECVDEPRFGYFWQRENREDKGRQAYMVDGREVADFDEAVQLLSQPIPDDSPDAIRRRDTEEFHASPRLNNGPYRALSEARCNADVEPFGMIRAWMHRADNAWHVGINAFSDAEREAKREFPHWLYKTKSAAHELYRAMYLFAGDEKKDTGLKCAYGVSCRDCPILKIIGDKMRERRDAARFPAALEDSDIHAALAWTCIGHVMDGKQDTIDGAFFTTAADRERGDSW